jgi:hypothetical protein
LLLPALLRSPHIAQDASAIVSLFAVMIYSVNQGSKFQFELGVHPALCHMTANCASLPSLDFKFVIISINSEENLQSLECRQTTLIARFAHQKALDFHNNICLHWVYQKGSLWGHPNQRGGNQQPANSPLIVRLWPTG